ncbi:MAG: CPBP family intramembrane metalloprotease [Saprospiraceae bacterium]|nr:CPBP family intramembrane metalloprotease [Saprospiraceae bacterium]
MSTNWYDHFLFALIGIVIPLMSFYSKMVVRDDDEDFIFPPKNQMYINNLFLLLIGVLMCLTAWHAGKNDWSILGFQMPVTNTVTLVGIGLLMAVYIIDGLIQIRSFRHTDDSETILSDILPANWTEYFYFLPLAIMAGISEEIIFRAYLYHYLISFYPDFIWGPYLTIFITSVGFSLSHLYQGWLSAFKICCISFLFGIIYINSGSLFFVIIIHILIDVLSGMSWLILPEHEEHQNQE